MRVIETDELDNAARYPDRERRLANTWPAHKAPCAPMTPAQLEELRSKAMVNKDSHSYRASVQRQELAERRAASKVK